MAERLFRSYQDNLPVLATPGRPCFSVWDWIMNRRKLCNLSGQGVPTGPGIRPGYSPTGEWDVSTDAEFSARMQNALQLYFGRTPRYVSEGIMPTVDVGKYLVSPGVPSVTYSEATAQLLNRLILGGGFNLTAAVAAGSHRVGQIRNTSQRTYMVVVLDQQGVGNAVAARYCVGVLSSSLRNLVNVYSGGLSGDLEIRHQVFTNANFSSGVSPTALETLGAGPPFQFGGQEGFQFLPNRAVFSFILPPARHLIWWRTNVTGANEQESFPLSGATIGPGIVRAIEIPL